MTADLVSRLRKHARKFNVASDSESIANEAADRIEALGRDINELDLVVSLLGIEDDHTTPSEAVTHLLGQVRELNASLSAILNTTPEERQNPAIWFKRVGRAKAALSGTVAPPAGLVEALECVEDSGLLMGPTVLHDQVRGVVRRALASHRSTPR